MSQFSIRVICSKRREKLCFINHAGRGTYWKWFRNIVILDTNQKRHSGLLAGEKPSDNRPTKQKIGSTTRSTLSLSMHCHSGEKANFFQAFLTQSVWG